MEFRIRSRPCESVTVDRKFTTRSSESKPLSLKALAVTVRVANRILP